MKTKVRISEITITKTIKIHDVDAVVLPTNAKIGAFTKPLSKVHDTPEEVFGSLQATKGDVLIRQRQNDNKFQAWGKTATARGARFDCDYALVASAGRRAKKRAAGTSKVYILYTL